MNFLQFLAHSEWPLITAFFLWLFRDQIKELIGRIIKLEAFGAKAELQERLNKADVLTETSAPMPSTLVPAPGDAQPSEEGSNLPPDTVLSHLQPVEPPPEVQVLRIFGELRGTIVQSYRMTARIGRGPTGVFDLSKMAAAIGLDADEIAAARELQIVRDGIAHGQFESLTPVDVHRFREVAFRLMTRIAELEAEWRSSQRKPDEAYKEGLEPPAAS